ncbi:hypothetical protein EJ08DRAFT_662859 [Tothia fuscella]|uniref:Uncharacterized protein n=1 Tax=Tothia fuscella TaxID=1048955 RepID=A0A9P4NMD9_9PEZI|nr:hypothetical protein EJ08DRAFT_662859 [Tothia fuscella]
MEFSSTTVFWRWLQRLFYPRRESITSNTHRRSYSLLFPLQPTRLVNLANGLKATKDSTEGHEGETVEMKSNKSASLCGQESRHTAYIVLDARLYPPYMCKDMAERLSDYPEAILNTTNNAFMHVHYTTLIRTTPWKLKLEKHRSIVECHKEPESVLLDKAVKRIRGRTQFPAWFFFYDLPEEMLQVHSHQKATIQGATLEPYENGLGMVWSPKDGVEGVALRLKSAEQEHEALLYMGSCFDVKQYTIQLEGGDSAYGYSFSLASVCRKYQDLDTTTAEIL